MINAELIQKIRNEIERLNNKMDDRDPLAPNQKAGYLFALADVLSFLDTLQEQDRPEPYNPTYDEAYLNEKIKKATESWKGVDVNKMLAECRGYDEPEVDLDSKVTFDCISKKVTMTIRELINYYIDRECCDVAEECGF